MMTLPEITLATPGASVDGPQKLDLDRFGEDD